MKNERTLKMMKNYISDFSSGLGPKEIAAKYNLSLRTVYSSLDEIAAKAGIPRDNLLTRPHDEHIVGVRGYRPIEPIRAKEFATYLNSTNKWLEKIVAQMEEQEANIDAVWDSIEEEAKTWN